MLVGIDYIVRKLEADIVEIFKLKYLLAKKIIQGMKSTVIIQLFLALKIKLYLILLIVHSCTSYYYKTKLSNCNIFDMGSVLFTVLYIICIYFKEEANMAARNSIIQWKNKIYMVSFIIIYLNKHTLDYNIVSFNFFLNY